MFYLGVYIAINEKLNILPVVWSVQWTLTGTFLTAISV